MNGNVTWDGAKADMDWMKRIGIGGLQAFDAGLGTPKLVKTRLPYMSPGWKSVFAKTANYADRLGLELGIASSPGWSVTGGPWVLPRDAMKKAVWSITRVAGGRALTIKLPPPPSTTGVFQTSMEGGVLGGRVPGISVPELYADTKVIAFRVPGALPTPVITASGGRLDVAKLSDGDLEASAIELPAAQGVGGISWVQFDYGRPVVVRGVHLATPIVATFYDALRPNLRNGIAPVVFRLEASENGHDWCDTGAKLQTGKSQRTSSVPSAKARYFRFVSVRQPPASPRRWERFMGPQKPPPAVLPIRELQLLATNTIDSFEEKAGFYNNADYYDLPTGTDDSSATVKLGDVIDITGRMSPDGILRWTPPKGEWSILRMGYSLVGSMNQPATPEATGLEVDKLDPDAVSRYIEHYLDTYRDASGGLMGKRGLSAVTIDSYEASNANWTQDIIGAFRRLRGYDPTPWLPALAGFQIESAEHSDAFLRDWRRTLGQLLKANHYDRLTKIFHNHGWVRYGEGHEELFVVPGDGMEMKQSADLPMGAMWLAKTPGEIEKVYWNDLQETASVAHIYGQNIAAAEALTGGPAFGSSPWDLKPTADAILLAGVNRFVIHTSTHQPVSWGPGTTLGTGQYFSRNETWAEQAKPWIDYLARASSLLQQGRAANDVAVFYGEAGPVIAAYRYDEPAVPQGYRYDYVNADVIVNRLSARDGQLRTETGMRYVALFFGRGTERVSLPVLRSTLALVRNGATLIGKRPLGSPSLADNPREVETVLAELWPGTPVATVGRGKVFASAEAAPALAAVGLDPDFTYSKPQPDSNVMFIHRRLDDGEIYFLSNRVDRSETIEASFRTRGHVPGLWDPATGALAPAAYHVEGQRTVVTVPLDRFGSTFVVFRGKGVEARRVAPAAETTLMTLGGPWNIRFQADRGAPDKARFDTLADFRQNADPAIRYFSGIAGYARTFNAPVSKIAEKRRLWIDLGKVGDLAEVWVNGRLMGTAWKPPYRVDIGSAIRSGRNTLEVRVVNLWVNRLIGDVQSGVTRKITFTAADGEVAAGTTPEQAARQKAMPYKPDAPLRPSGLMGSEAAQRIVDDRA